MLLAEVASVSREVVATSARLGKVAALSAALAAASPDEVPVVVAYLSGELPQRQIGVGWATLKNAPPPAEAAALTVAEVDAAFTVIGSAAGKGSAGERKRLVGRAFGRATADEQHFLVRLLSGELRQGALDGVMTDAVAKAAARARGGRPPGGDAAAVRSPAPRGRRWAAAARRWQRSAFRSDGQSSPCWPPASRRSPTPWRRWAARPPSSGSSTASGSRRTCPRGDVRLFTRTLDDITGRLPEVVADAGALPVRAAVLDGELIALREDGTAAAVPGHRRPRRPAQRRAGPGRVPLSVFLFDALHLDGGDLIDLPDAERHAALSPGPFRPSCSCRGW